jgi:hypothetical protein
MAWNVVFLPSDGGTVIWEGDSITYSGWLSSPPGNEQILFNDVTSNTYQVYLRGYGESTVKVTITWTGC